MGKIQAFTQVPGIDLRCPTCGRIMVLVVQTADATLIDARGVMYLKILS